ncbi:MAG: hypothetical protein K9I74_06650 [Bacteroidales bacterium]|nr:hypothetical protein [Bacteroidales bacterium]
MKTRFSYELIVGVVLLVAILLFGVKGIAAIALLAVHPFLRKKKLEKTERITLLFNKTGNYTAGLTLLASIIIYYFSDAAINDINIGDNWLGLVVSAFLISHGLAGLIIFRND